MSFNVKNIGSREGAEISELYVGDSHASVPRPLKELTRIIREVIRTTVSGARWDTNPSSWDWSSERIAEFWYRNVELQDRETGVP